MGDRSLDSLSSAFYPLACIVIARAAARGVPLLIAQTSRTPAEHAVNLKAGASSTALSLHLPRTLRWRHDLAPLDPADAAKADAIDLVPYDVYQLHGPDKLQYDGTDPAFGVIGEEAERLRSPNGQPLLRWGGRWRDPYDPGHVELLLPWKAEYLFAERARPWPTFRA